MNIVSVLAHRQDYAYSFTVDVSQDSVGLSSSEPIHYMFNGEDKRKFPAGDSINLLSMGAILPRGYEFYELKNGTDKFVLPTVSLRVRLETGVDLLIAPIKQNLPFGDYEISINTFLSANTLSETEFNLAFEFDTSLPLPEISMLNVPVSEDGKVYHVSLFAKIQHNLTQIV